MMKEVGNYTVINADGLILGRLASKVARRLLCGEKIAVVNSEMTVISGKRSSIIEDYKEKLRIRTLVNPAKGPFHARRPDKILRRAIRGMLPWDTTRGKEAFRRLVTFIGIPQELKDKKPEPLLDARFERLKGRFVRLGDISTEIGWRPLKYKSSG
jgi:large subunit ribosomal protein L13